MLFVLSHAEWEIHPKQRTCTDPCSGLHSLGEHGWASYRNGVGSNGLTSVPEDWVLNLSSIDSVFGQRTEWVNFSWTEIITSACMLIYSTALLACLERSKLLQQLWHRMKGYIKKFTYPVHSLISIDLDCLASMTLVAYSVAQSKVCAMTPTAQYKFENKLIWVIFKCISSFKFKMKRLSYSISIGNI